MIITTEEQLNRLIDERVAQQLDIVKRPKVGAGWLALRKEIDEYCQREQHAWRGRAYSYVQNAIYAPIKYALRLSRIDEIADEQIPAARQIFETIKDVRRRDASMKVD